MGELIAKLNVSSETGFLYYVKPCGDHLEIYKAKMARGGKSKKQNGK